MLAFPTTLPFASALAFIIPPVAASTRGETSDAANASATAANAIAVSHNRTCRAILFISFPFEAGVTLFPVCGLSARHPKGASLLRSTFPHCPAHFAKNQELGGA